MNLDLKQAGQKLCEHFRLNRMDMTDAERAAIKPHLDLLASGEVTLPVPVPRRRSLPIRVIKIRPGGAT